ncbi:MAG: hypothetical protein N2508_12030 [Anaerolineae bacterium]|nr:hypothetical protein [Anaerolineae bacterium]
MLQWRVIVLATLAVLTMLGGLIALILPERYEGPEIYRFDELHAIRALDAVGLFLLAFGSLLAWNAGRVWQNRMYGR